jgi:antitoxin PrlF
MLTAVLTDEGQATIPKEVRDHLGLKPGDHLRFGIQADGRVVLESEKFPVQRLKGILPKPERPVTLEEMDEAIGAAIVERYLRSRS